MQPNAVFMIVFAVFFAFLLLTVLLLSDNFTTDVIENGQNAHGRQDAENVGPSSGTQDEKSDPANDDPGVSPGKTPTYPFRTKETLSLQGDLQRSLSSLSLHADHVALLRVQDMTLLGGIGAEERIHPASMTKVMTLLVACDHIAEEEESVKVDGAVFEKYSSLIKGTPLTVSYQYESGDEMYVPVTTLLYLVGMESAADATLLLTEYLAGSHETFVSWMNQKAAALGLKDTHFTNAVGIYDDGLYSTAADMAVIMANAMQNETLQKVLGTDECYQPSLCNGKTLRFLARHTLFYDFFAKNTAYSRQMNGAFYLAAAKTGSETYKVNKKNVNIKALASMAKHGEDDPYVLVLVSESEQETVLRDLVDDNVAVFGADVFQK